MQQVVKAIAGDPLKLLNALRRTLPHSLLVELEPPVVYPWGSRREVVLSDYFYPLTLYPQP